MKLSHQTRPSGQGGVVSPCWAPPFCSKRIVTIDKRLHREVTAGFGKLGDHSHEAERGQKLLSFWLSTDWGPRWALLCFVVEAGGQEHGSYVWWFRRAPLEKGGVKTRLRGCFNGASQLNKRNWEIKKNKIKDFWSISKSRSFIKPRCAVGG